MARKLTEEERNSINLLTAAFVAAMPAHLRSHAGTVASSLVRIPRDVITARDINRIVGRIGEHKDELKALIRDVALSSVEVAEGEPETFVLAVPAGEVAEVDGAVGGEEAGSHSEDEAADVGAKNVKGATAAGGEKGCGKAGGRDNKLAGNEADTPEADPQAGNRAVAAGDAQAPSADSDEGAPVEASGPEKPARRSRRRRRVGDKGGLAAQTGSAAELAAGMDGEPLAGRPSAPEAESHAVPGQGEPDDFADASSRAGGPVVPSVGDALAEPAAAQQVGDPSESLSEAQSPVAEKKRRRTRRSKKKPAQAPQEDAAKDALSDAEPPAPLAGPTDSARVDAAAARGGEDEASDGRPWPGTTAPAENPSANEAQVAAGALDGVSDGAPKAKDDAAASDPASLGDSAAPASDGVPDAPESAGRPSQTSRGQRGGRGRRGSQNPKREGQKTLAEVPYIRRGGQTEADLRSRIVQLDQRFWMNGWLLSHPGAFQLYEKELLALNEFVVSGTMIGDVTRRQLAYQMGGDEKFFEYGSDGFKLLRSMGVEDLIRHRPLPKADLLFHAPRRRKHMRVLVTENLDPWLDVHDLMYEDGVSQILGERIHAVVLGGGTPVLEQNRLHLLLDTLGADSYDVLYWGDIDRAGLDILIKLQALLEGKFVVKPFFPAYQLMCDRAMERFPDPKDNEKTGQVNIPVGDTGVICEGLTSEAAEYARTVIENCSLIPQEILMKRDL